MEKILLKTTKSTTVLSENELNNTKGGLLVYCEEKRVRVLGMETTAMQMKVANDNQPGLTVRM